MRSKKKRLKDFRLCVVVNKPFFKDNRALVLAAREIVASGGRMVQLRDKLSDKKDILETALALKRVLRGTRSIFIVNDHVDIAKLVDADGVHLGQSDLPLTAARELLGKNKIIGVSCINLKQALLARDQGADYLGIGAVFPTQTKPESVAVGWELLKNAQKKIEIPIFAIGGINETNIKEVLSLGVHGVAISSAICRASDKSLATRRFFNIVNS